MPRPDPAFAWLLANDPQAAGLSRRQYADTVGILSPQDELDFEENECHYLDEIARYHCRACRDRARVVGNTVE